MSTLLSRTTSLLCRHSGQQLVKHAFLRGQLEGFYSMNPKFHEGTHAGGLSYQTIPQTVKHFATKPGTALREAWTAMGPRKEWTGIEKVPGKFWPKRIFKPGTPSAVAPSMGRLFLLGQGAEAIHAAYKARGAEARGGHIGRGIGGTAGWLLGSRMKFLPNLATFIGAEVLGSKLGKMIGRAVSKKKVR